MDKRQTLIALAAASATALTTGLASTQAIAQTKEPLRVSVWGGSWRDFVADIIGKRFTAETGVQVEYVTGGTIDRLTRAQAAGGKPETDIIFTTSHVGWLYANSNLYEKLEMAKIPNAKRLFPEAVVSPFHLATWSYVYTIAVRPDLVPGANITSWADLWNPKFKGMIGLPDFDPSHIIYASTVLAGGKTPKDWAMGQKRLLDLRPNIRAHYTNDATSQQMIGEGTTPIQIILSGNAYHMMSQGVKLDLIVPKEGAVLGLDTIGINRGTRQLELAYRFMNIALDPQVQTEISNRQRMGPSVTETKIDPKLTALPGFFTTGEQWRKQSLVIDHQQRAELLGDWRKWYIENVVAGTK
jgi:putative spermidine/putrescine transport system substrate-binding protein